MTDRELLEFAAKAAGIILEWDGPPDEWHPIYYEGKTYHLFNPLTDDGDAFRLSTTIEVRITHRTVDVDVSIGDLSVSEYVPTYLDRAEATRRAITRAAAEIGKQK